MIIRIFYAKPKAVSLFSGCGGSDYGLLKAGFEIVMANDNLPAAKRVYESNLETDYHLCDIATLKSFPEAELLVGCYPCQGFSQGGVRRSDRKINYLYREFDRALRLIKPKAFIVENVSGMTRSDFRHLLNNQITRFRLAGYRVSWKVLNALDYGVAQERRRIFLVGIKSTIDSRFVFPVPTHGPGCKRRHKTQNDVIKDLPEWPDGEFCQDDFHWYYLSRNRYRGWMEPSKTIVSRDRHIPLHPISPKLIKLGEDRWVFENNSPARRLSYREAARLQGFPKNFMIPDDLKLGKKYQVIGNAVPPPLFEGNSTRSATNMELNMSTNTKNSEIEYVDYNKLHLDTENPRLPETVTRKEKNILEWIAATTSIEDLMMAIAENGFFPGEPLIVYPHAKNSKEYIVIEGNRRLTAVRLLHNPNLYPKRKSISEIAENAKYRPEKLPIVIRRTRREVLPYLGFRHITGVKQWDPLAKARYMKQLFDYTAKDQPINNRYRSVAMAIGSRPHHIKRNVITLNIYQVIENENFFGIENLDEENIDFSVLLTAVSDSRIANFITTSSPINGSDTIYLDVDDQERSIKKKELLELTTWLFKKTETGKSIVGESRNIRQLSEIVNHSKALNSLRDGSSLEYAYRLTSGADKEFKELLYRSLSSLENANGMIAGVQYNESTMEVIKEIYDTARLIGITLQSRKDKNNDNPF